MKNKTYFIITLIILLILSIVFSAIVLASNENQETILTYEKISSIEDSYQEIQMPRTLSTVSVDETFDLSIIQKFDPNYATSKARTSDDIDIKYYANNLASRTEAVINTDGKTITFNADTKEFLSYIATNKNYIECDFSEEQIQQIATNIFLNLDLVENENAYIFVEQTKFDDTIWIAQFAKKYGNNVNLGETVKFSFSPISREIITLSQRNTPYANNEIVITEEQAISIASAYNKNTITNTTIEIVRPNYIFVEDDHIYKNVNIYRNSYVVTFDDSVETKVYVDATTGEVIGGTMIFGGER